jgi:uncharacterized protein
MVKKKYLKKLGEIALAAFILINVIAYFHAYKFTHFDTSIKIKTQDARILSFSQKLKTLFLGINNPRPENTIYPTKRYETIKLKSNKTIECWLIRADSSKGTIILFHGYGGSKSSMLDKANIFLSLGYNTLLVDFMGSGGSEGNQTTIGFKESDEVKTAFEFIRDQGEKNIVLFGTSMGAVAIMKAENDYNLNISSSIIECPFGTMLQTVKARFDNMNIPSFPMANLLTFWGGVQNGFDAFDLNPIDYAKNIRYPTLLLYGEEDNKVSRKEIDSIYKNLNGMKKLGIYPLAGHEDYLTIYKDKWTTDVSTFLCETRK